MQTISLNKTTKITRFDKILKHREVVSFIMAIAKTIPATCILTEINLENGKWTISGITDEAKSVWIFIHHLKETKLFNDMTISQVSQKTHVLFTIRLSNAH